MNKLTKIALAVAISLSATSISAHAKSTTDLSQYSWMKVQEVGKSISLEQLKEVVDEQGSKASWHFDNGIKRAMSRNYFTFAKTYEKTVKDVKMDFKFRRGGINDGLLTINVYISDDEHYTTKIKYKRANNYNAWKVQK